MIVGVDFLAQMLDRVYKIMANYAPYNIKILLKFIN